MTRSPFVDDFRFISHSFECYTCSNVRNLHCSGNATHLRSTGSVSNSSGQNLTKSIVLTLSISLHFLSTLNCSEKRNNFRLKKTSQVQRPNSYFRFRYLQRKHGFSKIFLRSFTYDLFGYFARDHFYASETICLFF